MLAIRQAEDDAMRWLDGLRAALEPYPWAYTLLVLAALLLLAWLANFVTRRILLRGLRRVLGAVAARHGDAPYRLKVVPRLANVVPALVISAGIEWVPGIPAAVASVVHGACQVWVVLTLAMAVAHVLDALNEVYDRRPDARNKPIKGYLQVLKIAIFVVAGLSVVATVAGVRFLHLVTGLGAATAVLMLIFQDTILSLVASVQISGDGRVRIGDWIEMPSQNADGDVIDIALHTVTVQNWDKTVTTIPTRKLISESFKNWRGMTESGGRRITNLGTFRAYVERYLRRHPQVHHDMTLLVRQLQPGSTGIPLEIYCFTSDTRWAVYEGVQSDIFDHLLAILPEFGLRVFQEPGGADFRAMLATDAPRPADAPAT